MLVDYDDSSDDNNQSSTKPQLQLQEIDQKKIKTVGLDQLILMSKKLKTNDGNAIQILQKTEEEDGWDPEKFSRDLNNNTIQNGEDKVLGFKNRPRMQLSKPKVQSNSIYSQQQDKVNYAQVGRKKLPPPPPGMSFQVAEQLAKSVLFKKKNFKKFQLLRKDDEEQEKQIQEFDADDEFIKDLEKMKNAQIKTFTTVDAQEAAQLGLKEGQQIREVSGNDLLDLDWRTEQAKKKQQQEAYMKVQLADPTVAQQGKNHITQLLKLAAEKEEEFDYRKQEQKYNIQKAKNKYGW